ncbi:MAG TPA: PilZ domain-containing protein [Pirellulales bacterium]|jgi:c-di-GMP-binding flagellar brake protein YcgR
MNERRRFERVPFFCDVSLTALPDGPTFEAHSFDISLAGVGLAAPRALAPGCMVTLSFTLRDGSGKETVNKVSGRVARCDADADVNRLGVEFLEPLSASASPQLMRRIMKI